MRMNLDFTGGLIMAEALTMALAPTLGRPEAYHIVQRLSDRRAQTGTHLRDLAASDEQVRAALHSRPTGSRGSSTCPTTWEARTL